MLPYWWIPVLVIFYVLQAWMSKENSLHGGVWFWLLFLTGIFPLWAIVSRYSKHLLFDGILYDVVMFGTFSLTLIALGGGGHFGFRQWIGMAIITAGFVLLKWQN